MGSAAAVPPELHPSAHLRASGRLGLRDDGRLRGRGGGEADRRGAGDVHVRHVPDAEPGAARPRRLPERRHVLAALHQPGGAARHAARAPGGAARTPCRSRPTAAPSSEGSSPRTTRPRRPTSARRRAGRRSRGSRCASSIPRPGRTSRPASAGEIVAARLGHVRGLPQRPGAAPPRRSSADGWFHTGDIGSRRCRRPHRATTGARRTCSRSAARTSPPLEIESYLSRHPAVRLAQVVASPTHG